MAVNLCWECKQPATHILTRAGSNTLHACDHHTRIDRTEAERLGWTITPIGGTAPMNLKPINTVGGFQLRWRSFTAPYDPAPGHQRVIGRHVYIFRTLPDRIDVWRADMADQHGGYRWTLVHRWTIAHPNTH